MMQDRSQVCRDSLQIRIPDGLVHKLDALYNEQTSSVMIIYDNLFKYDKTSSSYLCSQFRMMCLQTLGMRNWFCADFFTKQILLNFINYPSWDNCFDMAKYQYFAIIDDK